jgi:two-component system, OmpR family, sensor kinase
VTLAFVAGMTTVLLVVGLLIYVRYRDELTNSLDQNLRSRATDITTLLRESDSYNDILATEGARFAQILTPAGRVLDTTAARKGRSVLRPSDLRAAEAGRIVLERDGVAGVGGTARLLATPVNVHRRNLIVVTGTSLDDRDSALQSLRTLLLIGGPAALLLAVLIGYSAVAASLRPVEAIRRQASEISEADGARRLPVPLANDELRRLGETLNEMLARLEAALERERAFVDDASHELRTPLAMHRAELEVALRHAESPEELRAAITSAVEEVDRLSQLAEDLLVLARSDKGRLEIKQGQVDVGAMIGLVRDRFSSRAEAAGRSLDAEPTEGLDLDADQLRLEQALGNLVDNALRHGAGPVRLSALRADSQVELHVSDSGPGFAPGFLAHAFERFSRPDDARSGEGTGLGLAIVEAIALAHGGVAGAANRNGGGADVWIAIPLEHR